MDSLGGWALSGLALASILLPSSVQTSFALDRPVHLSAFVLFALACTCLAIGRFAAHKLTTVSEGKYASIPLEDVGQDHIHEERAERTQPRATDPRRLKVVFIALVALILARVEVFRRVVKDVQCAGQSWEVFLPFAFAVLDFVLVRRHARYGEEDEHASPYDVALQRMTRSPVAQLVSTALYGLSALAIQSLNAPLASTYICPSASGLGHVIPATQHFGALLEFGIAFCLHALVTCLSASGGWKGLQMSFSAIGWALLVSTVALWLEGFIWYITVPEDRHWTFTIPSHSTGSAVKIILFSIMYFVSALISLQQYGMMTTATVASFSYICAKALSSTWNHLHPFPPRSNYQDTLAFSVMLISILAFFLTKEFSRTFRHNHDNGSAMGTVSGILVISFVVYILPFIMRSTAANFHPIDYLLFNSQQQHDRWVSQATVSNSLSVAVEEYQIRYGRNPPPGFDKWYDFAVSKGSVIIDDYDRIHWDMLPFWSIPPAEVRGRLGELTANPWNDVGGVSVRQGKAQLSPNDMATHKWMLEGIVSMIEPFQQWLPDMDMGFNMNDEPRVTVPYEDMQKTLETAYANLGRNKYAHGDWSKDRAATWPVIPEEPQTATPFTEKSFQAIWRDWGNAACAPNSPARTQNIWNVGSFCTSCTDPHSLGVFLSNWSASSNTCQQPDVGSLHGLYLSPAAFKGTHSLYPVFSQSRTHGFNDILYPSAWNYMDKAMYSPSSDHPDPPFYKKESLLFWRGATSEGVSPGTGTWKGMTRQRFNALTSSLTSLVPVLLPYPFAPRGKQAYTLAPTADLAAHLPTDVKLVDTILRCGGADCPAQDAQFAPLAKPMHFQNHWRYKYLLDLDGAGFSGRFLPFLRSNSLPFKAALFREWHDERIAAWVHFVPLDIRGQGFWSTLMFFMGFEGVVNGKRVVAPGHEKEAQAIATAGKEWAERVLRKEDMQVYMFRLLLEWGRITDDRREDLGFVIVDR